MLTIKLLETIKANPSNVERRSSQITARKYFGAKIENAYPFSYEMFLDFVAVFRSQEVQDDNPSVRKPIPTSIALSVYRGKGEHEYESWLVKFLKVHCDEVKPSTMLTTAVFSAAILFINSQPGSIFHEFMMLHQLRETFKFKDSANYAQTMLTREYAVLQDILRIHAFLEDTINPLTCRVDRIQQALASISQERVSLNQRKLALLMLESYHISSASYNARGTFDMSAHERKNFRFILELSNILVLTEKFIAPPSMSLEINEALSENTRIQTVKVGVGVNTETISQPKTLDAQWEVFFQNLFDLRNRKDPVTIMTDILISNIKYNSSLLVWFTELGRVYQENSTSSILSENYRKLYTHLESCGELPAGAQAPALETVASAVLVAAAEEKKENDVVVDSVPDIIVEVPRTTTPPPPPADEGQPQISPLVAEALTTAQHPTELETKLASKHTGRSVTPVQSIIERHAELPTIYSEGNTPASGQRSDAVAQRVALGVSQQDVESVVASLFPKEDGGDEQPIVTGESSLPGTLAIKGDAISRENLDLKSLAFDANKSDAHEGKEEDDAASVADSEFRDEYDFFDAPDFPVESSEFANTFIKLIVDYYSTLPDFSDKNAIVLELIAITLQRHEQAKKLGVYVLAPQALGILNEFLQRTDLSLENVYEHLYAILQATVFAKRHTRSKAVKVHPFYQDAGATLMQLRKLVENEQVPAYTLMLQKTRISTLEWLQILTYKDESKITSEYDRGVLRDQDERKNFEAVTILKKLPFSWESQSLYPMVSRNPEIEKNLIEQRRRVEAVCVDILAGILAKPPGERLTITEKTLIVRAIDDYSQNKETSVFYNAMQFLVVTYHKVQNGVALLNSRLAIDYGNMLCRRLGERSQLFDLPDDSRLSRQELVMKKYLIEYRNKLGLSAGAGNEFDDGASEVSGQGSMRGSVANSYRSFSSTGSSVLSAGKASRDYRKAVVINEMTKGAWLSLISQDLENEKIRFILINYESIYGEVEPDRREESNELLHRAFDWLRALPPTQPQATVATSVFAVFGSNSKGTEELPHTDYTNYMAYVIPKKGIVSEIFAEYCRYQIHRVQQGQEMKTYEIKFILKNIRSLYIHRDQLNNGDELANATFDLVKVEWNTQLAKLEAKSTFTEEDKAVAKQYYKTTHDDKKERIKGNPDFNAICKRVSALDKKIRPASSSSVAVAKKK